MVLMLVALSAGMLTGLTATVMPQVQPVYADSEECEHNDDNNCGDRNLKIEQKNECKTETETEKNHYDTTGNNNGGTDNSVNTSNDNDCIAIIVTPNTGDGNGFGDRALVVPGFEQP